MRQYQRVVVLGVDERQRALAGLDDVGVIHLDGR
jgi:hypothetical protein